MERNAVAVAAASLKKLAKLANVTSASMKCSACLNRYLSCSSADLADQDSSISARGETGNSGAEKVDVNGTEVRVCSAVGIELEEDLLKKGLSTTV